MSKIILITGNKQIGKTSLLYQKFGQSNHVGGVLMPILEGCRHFYSLSRHNLLLAENSNPNEQNINVGRFSFSSEAFGIANQSIQNDIGYKPIIIIDEIGPLELSQSLGFKSSLDVCLERLSSIRYLILVVRPSLTDNLKNYCRRYCSDKDILITYLDSQDCADVS